MYIFTACMLFVLSLISSSSRWNKKKNKSLMIFACLWLILHDGLRWQVGSDWEPYYKYFFDPADHFNFEPAYQYLNIIVRSFTDEYNFFLIVVATFFYTLSFREIYRYSISPLMTVTIFYSIMVGMMGMNRQEFTLAISIFSVPFILNRDWKKFLIATAIGFCFHRTALLFLPAYFLADKKWGPKFIIVSITVLLVVYFSGVIKNLSVLKYAALLGSDFEYRVEVSMLDNERGFSAISGVVKRLLMIYLFYKFIYKKKCVEPHVKLFFNFYVFGVWLYLLTNGTYLQTIASRGALYYNIYECFLVPLLLFSVPIKMRERQILWLLIFIYYVYMLDRSMDSYLLMDAKEEVFRPYKSVLF